MTQWVLIVWLTMNPNSGIGVIQQQMVSEHACRAALREIIATESSARARGVCVRTQ